MFKALLQIVLGNICAHGTMSKRTITKCKYCDEEHASSMPCPYAVRKNLKLTAMTSLGDSNAGQLFDPPRLTASSSLSHRDLRFGYDAVICTKPGREGEAHLD